MPFTNQKLSYYRICRKLPLGISVSVAPFVPSALPQALSCVFTWRFQCLRLVFPVRLAMRSTVRHRRVRNLCVPRWVPKEFSMSSQWIPDEFLLSSQWVAGVFTVNSPWILQEFPLPMGTLPFPLRQEFPVSFATFIFMCFPTSSRWVPYHVCLLWQNTASLSLETYSWYFIFLPSS